VPNTRRNEARGPDAARRDGISESHSVPQNRTVYVQLYEGSIRIVITDRTSRPRAAASVSVIVFSFFKSSGVHMKVFTEEGLVTKIRSSPPTASAAEETNPPPLAPVLSGSETILVVEDDPLVRDLVITQLRSLGYLTIAAADGRDALVLIERGAVFDLLFTDVIMPNGINGPELSDEITSRRPGTKVLFTSGYTDNTMISDSCRDDSVLLLSKPYRKAQLARMVRMALDG
jgi:CheY-like chemotaxis protein